MDTSLRLFGIGLDVFQQGDDLRQSCLHMQHPMFQMRDIGIVALGGSHAQTHLGLLCEDLVLLFRRIPDRGGLCWRLHGPLGHGFGLGHGH